MNHPLWDKISCSAIWEEMNQRKGGKESFCQEESIIRVVIGRAASLEVWCRNHLGQLAKCFSTTPTVISSMVSFKWANLIFYFILLKNIYIIYLGLYKIWAYLNLTDQSRNIAIYIKSFILLGGNVQCHYIIAFVTVVKYINYDFILDFLMDPCPKNIMTPQYHTAIS